MPPRTKKWSDEMAPRMMPKGMSTPWLEQMLQPKGTTAAGREQHEHDIKAVAHIKTVRLPSQLMGFDHIAAKYLDE